MTEAPGRLRPESSPPDFPATRDRADQGALTESGDHVARWSKADLRQRLHRLPPGHPSSPHSDDPESSQAEKRLPRESAERETDRAGTSGRGADAIKQDYWSEVPRFQRAWDDHVRRWPGERAALDVNRSRDPGGSARKDAIAGSLNPEQLKQAEGVIAGVRRTEEALTERVEESGRDNVAGAWLEGLEFRLKSEERLKEKIADLLETAAPDASTEEIVRQIPDAIRYTFCAQSEEYRTAYWDIKGQLETRGYEMYYSENHWSDTQYKGINTRWVTPEGQRFEVQFHTPESFHAKQTITHVSYERLRSASASNEERQQLKAFQEEVCSWIVAPEGATDIPNYRKEGH